MAIRAGIRNFVFVGPSGSDDLKGVGADVNAGEGGLDFRHVARDAVAGGMAGAAGSAGELRENAVVELAGLVMSVLFERRGVGAVEGHGAVAFEAELIGGLA